MDLIAIVLTSIFWGKTVKTKGYDVVRWRVRHISACIFVELSVGLMSYSYSDNLQIAAYSSMLALAGLLFYRYQNVKQLEEKRS